MKRTTLLASLLIACSSAQALPLDNMMSCSMPTRDFFATLVQAQAIQTPAYKVTHDGVNAFQKTSANSLTFFGMTVGLVVGYANDPMFQRSPDGAAPGYEGYGFFVQAPVIAVQAILDNAGYKATRLQREPSGLTLVSCRFPNP